MTERCKEKFNNWVKLSDKDIEAEYEYEYKNHVRHDVGNIFPTLKSFLEAVKKAQEKPHCLNEAEDGRMANRSHCPDIECINEMISGYRSYPLYRNERTVAAIDEGFKNGAEMKMPIVLLFESGRMRVMSGNTRLDIAFINEIDPMVILVPVPPGSC